MTDYKLTFDLYCDYESVPTYRLYVNNKLITERDYWIDADKNYLECVIDLWLESGNHTFYLEWLDPVKTHVVDNICINQETADYSINTDNSSTTVNFTV